MNAASPLPILTVDSLSKTFGPRRALDDVSLEVRAGEIYALLGPNGAGKTTLVRAVCGLNRPDHGRVRVLGRDPFSDGAARAALGLAPQAVALYPLLTVEENLQAFASLAGLKGRPAAAAVARSMAVTETGDRARSLIRQLSGGLQRRVNIAAAILADPKLLVLDEPTAGVDLAGREAIGEVLRQLKGLGVAVLLVTHDLDQAGGLADRAGFLRAGEKVLEGAPAALLDQAFGAAIVVEVDVGAPRPGSECLLEAEGLTWAASAGIWRRLDANGYGQAGRLAERLSGQGLEVREVRVRRPTLADLFAHVAAPGGSA